MELAPLSYALFAELFEHRGEVVSVERLSEAVWGSVTVAPDTLKQRVFLLRKALDDAGLDEVEVQSVRGQGYRLLLAGGAASKQRPAGRLRWIGLGLAVILAGVLYGWISRTTFDAPANDRVVHWNAGGPATGRVASWEARWISRLTDSDVLTYVVSDRISGTTITEQSRSSRAAVVSLWTVVDSGDRRRLRMQLLEPKTAAVLRADLADPAGDDAMESLLDAHVGALERLVDSGELPLARDALLDTDHPAWDTLRGLADTQR